MGGLVINRSFVRGGQTENCTESTKGRSGNINRQKASGTMSLGEIVGLWGNFVAYIIINQRVFNYIFCFKVSRMGKLVMIYISQFISCRFNLG